MGFEVYSVRVENSKFDLFLFLIFLFYFISILFSYFGLRIRGWCDIKCDCHKTVTYWLYIIITVT